MRPRPDAAENRGEISGQLYRRGLASMRPRPDAAENRLLGMLEVRFGAVLQ